MQTINTPKYWEKSADLIAHSNDGRKESGKVKYKS